MNIGSGRASAALVDARHQRKTIQNKPGCDAYLYNISVTRHSGAHRITRQHSRAPRTSSHSKTMHSAIADYCILASCDFYSQIRQTSNDSILQLLQSLSIVLPSGKRHHKMLIVNMRDQLDTLPT